MHNIQIRQRQYIYVQVCAMQDIYMCKRYGVLNKHEYNSVLVHMFIAQWGDLIVHEVDGLRKETFLVPGCIGAQCSV